MIFVVAHPELAPDDLASRRVVRTSPSTPHAWCCSTRSTGTRVALARVFPSMIVGT